MKIDVERTADMSDVEPEILQAALLLEKEFELRNKIVLARKESGLTQTEMVEDSGLTNRAISRVEKNLSVSPNVRTLIKYLDAIGYELDIVKNV